MNAIKFLTDVNGKQNGLFIDFEVIEQAKAAGEDMGEFLDTLEDRIALELSRFDTSEPLEPFHREAEPARAL
jgi:hypothetical protein